MLHNGLFLQQFFFNLRALVECIDVAVKNK